MRTFKKLCFADFRFKYMPFNFLRSVSLMTGVFSTALIAVGFLITLKPSSAQIQITNQPAAQGRSITPAGRLIQDAATKQPAVGSLTTNFVRSPDTTGADGAGRYLIAVNSGFGLQFKQTSRPQQSLAVIDLNAQPEPQVIQNVYFPSPSSACFGAAFHSAPEADGSYRLYIAGGIENRIWQFRFVPGEAAPVSPGNQPDAPLTAPFIDVNVFSEFAPTTNYNNNQAPIYPIGVALAPDGNTLYAANNLGDTLGIIADLNSTRRVERVSLRRPGSTQFAYPYDVKVVQTAAGRGGRRKVFVSLWGDGSVAVIDGNRVSHIAVDRHPTAMLLNRAQTRLYVVNSNADSVSTIDTATNRVIERINVKLAENAAIGASPEGLALSTDEKTLYVANAHANAVAVVSLSSASSVSSRRLNSTNPTNSKLLGFIPTGQYASAIAAVGNRLIVANGKGTGVENSSYLVNNSGRAPNMPNPNFPGSGYSRRGAYNPALVASNYSLITSPNEQELFALTQSVMRNNGLLGRVDKQLFAGGRSPFKHVIYIIRENRTYDQVFGDLPAAGDGTRADGDPSVAIFGAGETAKSPNGATQNITPNARALALRFGLLDRFFVNAEASPDGHNWSTAAFSNDYVDKTFRWNYSGRGRTYDFEGFNRLPNFEPPANQPSVLPLPANENTIAAFMQQYVPYLQGSRDVGEPETLYLWDAANRAGLTYRNYGEFVATISEEDVREINTRKSKTYPDTSPNVKAFATKKTLENHFSPTFRNYDTNTPDAMTLDSYRAARANNSVDAAITRDNADARLRGNSRLGEWLNEFRGFVADVEAGRPDRLPNLSIVRFGNDHTAGLRPGIPTPQFYVAENDYALGRLVEAVSNSPYWRDTAIFVVEDDAQDGPDHVDAHRSPAFVISAYNRRGALVHEFHNTVSLIRTMEICLGLPPMNLLDATATPIDIFTGTPDLTTYKSVLPEVALDNLLPPNRTSAEMRRYMQLTDRQDLEHADMANPLELNEIIWFSVRGGQREMPEISRLPAFELMTAGVLIEDEEEEREEMLEEAEERERVAQTMVNGN